MADSGNVSQAEIDKIKNPREYLLDCCKKGSSKNVAAPIALVKKALGKDAEKVLSACRGNSTVWTQANRADLIAALETRTGAPA